mmetsp:Transcript_154524/g.269132  ORF Transcript_154524/g.269132 Transcript_154524/m.269132 type:complete len:213 (+) Transcript_154524:397-1035(+)
MPPGAANSASVKPAEPTSLPSVHVGHNLLANSSLKEAGSTGSTAQSASYAGFSVSLRVFLGSFLASLLASTSERHAYWKNVQGSTVGSGSLAVSENVRRHIGQFNFGAGRPNPKRSSRRSGFLVSTCSTQFSQKKCGHERSPDSFKNTDGPHECRGSKHMLHSAGSAGGPSCRATADKAGRSQEELHPLCCVFCTRQRASKASRTMIVGALR